jgi:hypothetical protein
MLQEIKDFCSMKTRTSDEHQAHRCDVWMHPPQLMSLPEPVAVQGLASASLTVKAKQMTLIF